MAQWIDESSHMAYQDVRVRVRGLLMLTTISSYTPQEKQRMNGCIYNRIQTLWVETTWRVR